MDILTQEVPGEIQPDNEKLLAEFEHNRIAEEYEQVFRESQVILQKPREYGIEEAVVEEVPIVSISHLTWDAEAAELWMLEPEKRKLICLEDVPSCLCEQSQSSEVKAELVYVGLGDKERYYAGKDIRGKIALITGRPLEANVIAVGKSGAVGLISCNETHPELDPNKVIWDSIARYHDPPEERTKELAFGFMISPRTGEELRQKLGQGEKIVIKALCKTKNYPARNELDWTLIKGREKLEGELVMKAHLFEGKVKQGANDNASGCVSLLETARVIAKLVRESIIPCPRRSTRFLWIDGHVETLGYIQKNPEILKRFFANINEDMVGEAIARNKACFYLKTTPYSLPSYLDDVMTNFIEYVGENNRDSIINRPVRFLKPIVSPAGTRDPFYHQIDKFYCASDHDIFLDEGIGFPAISFIVWPDLWHHTNRDHPDKSDSNQLKRVSVIDTAAVIFLAQCSAREAIPLAGEVQARGKVRIGEEEKRAYGLISKNEPTSFLESYNEAKNIVQLGYQREIKTIQSIAFFSPDDNFLSAYLQYLYSTVGEESKHSARDLFNHYKSVFAQLGVSAVKPQLSHEERRLLTLIPHRTKKMEGYSNNMEFQGRIKKMNPLELNLQRFQDFEICNFIDGQRSILEMRNAMSSEFRPIPFQDVENYNYIHALAMDEMVSIEKTLNQFFEPMTTATFSR